MTIGSIPSTLRLGIANMQDINASSFATTVLQLPAGVPIYQQQLVHSTVAADGPASAAAEVCGNYDSDAGNNSTVREIASHDTLFARRNVRDTPQAYNLEWHRSHYTNQIYYVNNEPEIRNPRTTENGCAINCWNPRDRNIDSTFQDVFTPAVTTPDDFFEDFGQYQGDLYCSYYGEFLRVKPEAMAFVYLRLRRQTEFSGNVVLPPSAQNQNLDISNPNTDQGRYYSTFYDKVHGGVTINGVSEQGISPANLHALHLHHYPIDPRQHPQPFYPLMSVARSASFIRNWADWYRNRYTPGNPIPTDILLSEMGADWRIAQNDPKVYSGGWDNFCDGLLWWNSWLAWLTRRAPYECNLQGWDTGSHSFYSCIHEPTVRPYTSPDSPNSTRNQLYLYSSDWLVHTWNSLGVINTGSVPKNGYESAFTTVAGVNYNGHPYRRTPFGRCYTVWANVGADPVAADLSLNHGWVYNTQAGIAATATITFPYSGFHTVYFPIMKATGNIKGTGTQFNIRWIRYDNATCDFGKLAVADYEDSTTYNYWGYDQIVYASMVFPVTFYNFGMSSPVTIQISRNIAGPGIWIGRPIVLYDSTTWFANQ